MTEVINNRNALVPAPMQQQEQKDSHSYIPEIIEENRIDSTGKADCTKYVRGKLLGKGGFGRCYVGTTMNTKVVYALKIVPKSSLVKSKAKSKLQSEIRIHRNLRHQHIVRFDRYFEDIHNVYIVLELCSNNSMSELLKRRKRLVEPEVRFYLQQLVESLKYLHQALIIHRDLKLGNLFIDSNLRIKVGDFGLATKLSHAEERKRTVCGTPNYLAPEILEGKDGHSFEVDIWSTGVVMYTLLVGKPPFESKDMKATYKRILANSYTFPDHVTVSEDAKSLIRSMLQHRPDRRPSLDDILSHAFFSSSSAYLPSALPESALKETPVLIAPLQSGYSLNDKLKNFTSSTIRAIGDENDANAMNRANQMPTNESENINSNIPIKSAFGRASRSSSVLMKSLKSSGVTTQEEDDTASTAPKKSSITGTLKSILQPTQSSISNRLDKVRTSFGAKPAVPSVVATTSSNPAANTRSSRTQPSSSSSTQNKFEVYEDTNNINNKDKSSPKNLTYGAKRSAFDTKVVKDDAKKIVKAESGYLTRHMTHRVSSSSTPNTDKMNIDELQQDLECIHLSSNTAPSVSDKKFSSVAALTSPGYSLKTHAWTSSTATPAPTTQPEHIDLHTPPDQIISQAKEPKGTLEEMHEMLDKSYINNTNFPNIINKKQGLDHSLPPPPTTHRAITTKQASINSDTNTKVWVVRYVDYTSKYGLGFLLNTGSAGVYFNDSTKIIVSPDGSTFQYIERMKKGKDNGPSSPSESYHIQTHLMTAYPVELQKKVTLLRHFRNYLIEQQRLCAQTYAIPSNKEQEAQVRMEDIYGGGPTVGDEVQSLPMLPDVGTATGANAMIKYGHSSVQYHLPSSHYQHHDDHHDHKVDVEMPYVKKWVRTKHAILFRMSNRTVQVLFFDKSEILLSSEANMVTYVNKQSIRSEHSLEEVMQTGRTDIAKRLRYTKDIMYRLIHLQSK